MAGDKLENQPTMNDDSILGLVEKLKPMLVSVDLEERKTGLEQLSDSLSGHTLRPEEIGVLLNFVLSKLQDGHALGSVCMDMLCKISQSEAFATDHCVHLLLRLLESGVVRSLPVAGRLVALRLLSRLLARGFAQLVTQWSEVVTGFINVLDGERDPRVLLSAFPVHCFIARNFRLGPLAEDLFDVVACYFPVDTQGKSANCREVELQASLTSCLLSTDHFGPFCIQLVLEKWSDPVCSEWQKSQATKLLDQAFDAFPSSVFAGQELGLWTGLKHQLFQGGTKADQNQHSVIMSSLGKLFEVVQENDGEKGFENAVSEACQRFLFAPQLGLHQAALETLLLLAKTHSDVSILEPVVLTVSKKLTSSEPGENEQESLVDALAFWVRSLQETKPDMLTRLLEQKPIREALEGTVRECVHAEHVSHSMLAKLVELISAMLRLSALSCNQCSWLYDEANAVVKLLFEVTDATQIDYLLNHSRASISGLFSCICEHDAQMQSDLIERLSSTPHHQWLGCLASVCSDGADMDRLMDDTLDDLSDDALMAGLRGFADDPRLQAVLSDDHWYHLSWCLLQRLQALGAKALTCDKVACYVDLMQTLLMKLKPDSRLRFWNREVCDEICHEYGGVFQFASFGYLADTLGPAMFATLEEHPSERFQPPLMPPTQEHPREVTRHPELENFDGPGLREMHQELVLGTIFHFFPPLSAIHTKLVAVTLNRMDLACFYSHWREDPIAGMCDKFLTEYRTGTGDGFHMGHWGLFTRAFWLRKLEMQRAIFGNNFTSIMQDFFEALFAKILRSDSLVDFGALTALLDQNADLFGERLGSRVFYLAEQRIWCECCTHLVKNIRAETVHDNLVQACVVILEHTPEHSRQSEEFKAVFGLLLRSLTGQGAPFSSAAKVIDLFYQVLNGGSFNAEKDSFLAENSAQMDGLVKFLLAAACDESIGLECRAKAIQCVSFLARVVAQTCGQAVFGTVQRDMRLLIGNKKRVIRSAATACLNTWHLVHV